MKCFKLKVTRIFNGSKVTVSKWSVRHFKVGGLMVLSFMVIVVHTFVNRLSTRSVKLK